MQTIIIKLDSEKLDNPDLDIIYNLPERIEEYTNGQIKDNGYDYLSDTEIGIWLESENVEENVKYVTELLKNEKFCGNDLSVTAEIYISSRENAEINVCERLV